MEMTKMGFGKELLTLGNPYTPALSFVVIFMYLFRGLWGSPSF